MVQRWTSKLGRGGAHHWSHHSPTRSHQLLELHLPHHSCRPPLAAPAGAFELTASSCPRLAPRAFCAFSTLSSSFFFSGPIAPVKLLTERSSSRFAPASYPMASTDPQRIPTRERRPSTSAPIVDIQGSVSPAGISRPKHKRTFTGFGAGDIKNVEGGDTLILAPAGTTPE